MFKNMSLSKKMALGFGVLIVIAGVLGGVAWSGLRSVAATAALDARGAACLDTLNKCATQRRDFALRGFAKADGETKTAADLWRDSYAQLTDELRALQGAAGLSAAERNLVGTALEKAAGYLAAFEKVSAARTARDEAFAEWGKVGRNVTAEIEKALADTINPAVAAAVQSQKLEDITRWNEIRNSLNADFVEAFLLLRVSAVYLLATNQEPQWVAFQEQLKQVKTGLATWTQSVSGEQGLESLAANLQGCLRDYEAAGQKYHDGIVADQGAGAEMAATATGIVDTVNQLSTALKNDMAAITARTNSLTLGMAVGAIILGVVLAMLITRSIVRPINRIIAGLNEGSDQVNDAAAQVAAASQQLAEGASEQASSLEETSSALEEMAAMTRTNAENARQANELSDQAKTAAQDGDQTMTQLNSAMAGINESSGKISKIIKVIEEIAFQTNLLALNAAVEAARAGEHGKGFAVVADEVRNLAQRAAQASREVTGLIEDSVGRAREGTTVASEVAKSLGAIVADVTKVADLVNGITRASQEQAQGVDQVNIAVSQMDKVTQQNAAGAEESASAAEELSAQATTVKGMVDELAGVIGGAKAQAAAQARSAAASAARNQKRAGMRHHFDFKKPQKSEPAPANSPSQPEAVPAPVGEPGLSDF